MRKFYVLIFLLFSVTLISQGQNAIVGTGFSTGWGDSCYEIDYFKYLTQGAGSSYIGVFNANGSGNQYFRFGVDWGNTKKQLTTVLNSDTEIFENEDYQLDANCTNNGAMFLNVSSTTDNYIFKTFNAGENPTGKFVVFKVQGDIQNVISVGRQPEIVRDNNAVTITAYLSSAFSPGQGAYLRYTNDNWATSTVVSMATGSGTTYTATIPQSANTESTTISYYVFTSGANINNITHADADLYTINSNTNGGLNYSYVVKTANSSVLFDDFNRSNNNTVGVPTSNPGGSWIEIETKTDNTSAKIDNNKLKLQSTIKGMDIVAFDMSNIYPVAFDAAMEEMTWAVNMYSNRSNLSGFGSENFAMAFVLGSNKPDYTDSEAYGYAVVLGNNSTPKEMRLIHFKKGLKTTGDLTTIITHNITAEGNQFTKNVYSVNVTYNSCSREWSLKVRDNGTSNWQNPLTGSFEFQGVKKDTTYTATELPYMGIGWKHNTAADDYMLVDDIYVPSDEPRSNIEYLWTNNSVDFGYEAYWTPTRQCPRRRDRLVFEGPGNFEVKDVPNETIGQLIIRDTAIVILRNYSQSGAAAIDTLHLTGGKGEDFIIEEGSVLNLNVKNTLDKHGIRLNMLSNTTGEISGVLRFDNDLSSYSPFHQLTVKDANTIRVKHGGRIEAIKLNQANHKPFGDKLNIGYNGIIFENGSVYLHEAGAHPFGVSQPNSKVVFESGSLYHYHYSSTPSMSGRVYANFLYEPTGGDPNLPGTSNYSIDTLMVINGSLNFELNATGTIKGDIYVANGASLSFNPSTTVQNLEFKGSVTQRIYGDGNLTFGDSLNVVIDKPSSTDSVIIDKKLTIQRNLFIKKGWVALNEKLTVGKNVVMGEGSDEGRLSLSPGFGGDLELGGDFIINAQGVFNPNNRAVFFTGNADQTITSHNTTDNNEVTLNYMVVEKAGGNLILNNAPPTSVSVIDSDENSNALVLSGAKIPGGADSMENGNINLNGQKFNLGGLGDFLVTHGTRHVLSSTTSQFNFVGKKKIESHSSGSLEFNNDVIVNISDGVDFGSELTTINAILQINGGGYVNDHAPWYGPNGILKYNTNADPYIRRVEWSGTEGQPGYPNDVIVAGNTILNPGGDPSGNTDGIFAARRDVTIEEGSAIYMDYDQNDMTVPLKVGRDLIIHGNLSASDSPGGDIHVGRDWLRTSTGSFNPKNRQVLFNGTEPQTITAPGVGETFDWLGFDNTGTKTLNSDITVNKKLEIFANSGALNAGDKIITLKGDWENKAGLNGFDAGTSTVIFNGEQTQYFDAPTAKVENFYKVKIDNSEGILLKDTLGINNELILESGIVNFDNPDLEVHYRKDAISSPGKATSYINGKARKTWGENTDLFIFPVGQLKDTIDVYQPAGLTPEVSNAEFTVDYVHENYFPGTWVPGNSPPMASTLETVSGCDFWNINRTGSSPGAKVRLYWSEKCFDISDTSALVVAKVEDESWVSTGSSTTNSTAPYESGYVETNGYVSTFSPFAIGSSSSINVLPIELISFDATVHDGVVETHWVTATEKNNAYFTVERSVDARHFTEVGRVEGAGNSTVKNTYSLTDPAPYSGISYYRLKQTDFDGNYTYSEIRSVRIDRDSKFELIKAYRSELGLHLAYRSETEVLHAEIFDLVGKKIYRTQIRNTGGFSTIHPNLVRGIYLLRLSNGMEAVTEKFFW